MIVKCIHCGEPDNRPDYLGLNMPYCFPCWMAMQMVQDKSAQVLFNILKDTIDKNKLNTLFNLMLEDLHKDYSVRRGELNNGGNINPPPTYSKPPAPPAPPPIPSLSLKE